MTSSYDRSVRFTPPQKGMKRLLTQRVSRLLRPFTMAYAMQRYFRCPMCVGTKVVTDNALSHTVSVKCRCKEAYGYRVEMQEITAAEYNQGKAPAQPPKKPAGRHYDWMTFDDVANPSWSNQYQAPATRKCKNCGQDTTNRAGLFGAVCDACEIRLIQTMQQLFMQQKYQTIYSGIEPTRRVTWHHCRGCGDLLPAASGLHQCPVDSNAILVPVTFEEKPMTPVTNVRVWWDASVSAYRLASPYNKDLVEGIKANIPISDRSFDPQSKIWTFVERQLDPLLKFFKLMNIQATVITRQQAEQASQSTPTGPKRGAAIAEVALEFMRVAGPDAMTKAYRAAAMSLHPDRGGNMDKMSALNAAWERLQKEVYGQ